MTDASAVRPEAELAENVATALTALVDVSAGLVYGQPVTVGDRVIVSAATIERAGGYGFGRGEDTTSGSGAGGGGGGYAAGRPVAVIEVGPEGVRVKPVLDFTKIGLTVIAAALTIWKATRRSR